MTEHLTLKRYLDITRGADFLMQRWKDRAECALAVTQHPEQYQAMDWFPLQGQTPKRVAEVCDRCPVRIECLAYAVYTHENEGIWGGHSARSIKRMRRKIEAALRKVRG